MIRHVVGLASFAALWLVSQPSVYAQGFGPRSMPAAGPTTSPYLNMLRLGNNNRAVNYFGIVRPQFQAIAGFQALQQQFGQLLNNVPSAAPPSDGQLETGHSAGFLNYNSYFMTLNAGRGGAGTPSFGRPPQAQQFGGVGINMGGQSRSAGAAVRRR